MKNKICVRILVPCDEAQRRRLEDTCGDQYDFLYPEDEGSVGETEVIIGEPDLKTLPEYPALSWIQMTWAGTDKYTRNVRFPEHVKLTNASGAFGVIISEYVIGGILSLYRHFPEYHDHQKQCLWQDAGPERSLFGQRILILGCGDIGRETARRLKAFGTVIHGIRRKAEPLPEFDRIGTMENLEQELPLADIVISCLPNSPRTEGTFTYERLRLMKEEAVIVNVGRGQVFAGGALERILGEGWLYGAVLDVQSIEPLPENSPLWKNPRVLLTPHIAGPSFGHCRATEEKIWDIVITNLQHYAKGESLEHLIRPGLKEGVS